MAVPLFLNPVPALASAPKPGKPGPGRPPGSKNRRPAIRHDVGKTVKRDQPQEGNQQAEGLNNKLRAAWQSRLALVFWYPPAMT